MLYYAMAQPEGGRQDERLYINNIKKILAYPEAYDYREVSLTPEPLDDGYFRVGLIAALPTKNPRVCTPLLDSVSGQFCHTSLCKAFLRTNADPALRQILTERSEREAKRRTRSDSAEHGTRRIPFYPNTIALFSSTRERLSVEPLGISLLVPNNTDLLEAYDETVRMMVSVLRFVEPTVASRQ